MLSTSCVRSAKRVRLADLVAGVIRKPPTLVGSSGEDYEPPTISASRTLESRYSSIFLVVYNVLSGSSLYVRVWYFVLCMTMSCFKVADLEPGPGAGSSTDSDVFVCVAVVETPVQESDAASLLPDELSRNLGLSMDGQQWGWNPQSFTTIGRKV